MASATMVVNLHYDDWEKFKPFLDNTNAHRKQFTGTGHTLARDLDDPQRVTVVVRFADLDRAKGSTREVTAVMAPVAVTGRR